MPDTTHLAHSSAATPGPLPDAPGRHPAAPAAGALWHDWQLLNNRAASRRRALRWLAVGGVTPLSLMACGGGDAGQTLYSSSSSTSSGSSTSSSTSSGSSCSTIPSETAGPYPGDGSNSANGSIANALTLSGIVRSDITSSIAGASGVAEGVPLTLTLTLVDSSSSCASLAGYAIYLWHCDRDGQYSMYASSISDENYLRGVQETDANGQVTFQTIVPGCYDGRVPHMHFEVYPSLASATSSASQVKTSQLTFPTDMLDAAYAEAGYEDSVSNLASVSVSTDNVFSDGVSLQMCTVSGSVSAGYSASLQVAIAA